MPAAAGGASRSALPGMDRLRRGGCGSPAGASQFHPVFRPFECSIWKGCRIPDFDSQGPVVQRRSPGLLVEVQDVGLTGIGEIDGADAYGEFAPMSEFRRIRRRDAEEPGGLLSAEVKNASEEEKGC